MAFASHVFVLKIVLACHVFTVFSRDDSEVVLHEKRFEVVKFSVAIKKTEHFPFHGFEGVWKENTAENVN